MKFWTKFDVNLIHINYSIEWICVRILCDICIFCGNFSNMFKDKYHIKINFFFIFLSFAYHLIFLDMTKKKKKKRKKETYNSVCFHSCIFTVWPQYGMEQKRNWEARIKTKQMKREKNIKKKRYVWRNWPLFWNAIKNTKKKSSCFVGFRKQKIFSLRLHYQN